MLQGSRQMAEKELGCVAAAALRLGLAAPLLAPPSAMAPPLAKAASPTKLAVGQAFVAPAAAGFWVGRDRGTFARYGLDVDITNIQGSAQAVQALLAGSSQVMLGAPAQGLLAAAAGTDLISIASLGPQMPYLLVARPELRSPADLKGKKLGVSSVGPSSDRVAQLLALKQLNLDPKRDGISFIVTGTQAQRVQALAAGRVDARTLDSLQPALARPLGMARLSDLGKLERPAAPHALLV